jgi:hypothetical protein
MPLTIPGLPSALKMEEGVVTNAPPAGLIAPTHRLISDAVAELGTQKGIATWILTTTGVNLALVDKVGDHVAVTLWIGKTWGEPLSAGLAGEVTW